MLETNNSQTKSKEIQDLNEEYFESKEQIETIPYWKTIIIVKYILILIRYPGFRYLWIGNFIGLYGDFFNYIACIQLMNLYLPGSTSIAFACYILMESLPAVLISPIAGVIADKFDRRKVMLIADLLRSIIVLSNLFVRSSGTVWILYTTMGIQSICASFFYPARSATFPNTITNPDDLFIANSLNGSTWAIAASFASGLGGFIVYFFGTNITFILDSITYLFSAFCILQLFRLGITGNSINEKNDEIELKNEEIESKVLNNESSLKNEKKKENFFRMFINLFFYFKNNLDVFWLSFARGFCSLIFGSLEVSHIAYLKSEKSLHSPALIIGMYFTVIGVSVFLGPVILEKYSDKSPKGIQYWIIFGFLIQAICTFIASFSFHFIWMILFGAFFRPIGESFILTLGTTYLQRAVPDDIRGRVFSFSGAFFNFSIGFSSLTSGILIDVVKVSIFQDMLIFSALNILIVIMYLIYLLIYLDLWEKGKVSKEFIDQ